MIGEKEFGQFHADALGADAGEFKSVGGDRAEGCRLDFKAELRTEADGAHNAQRVFAKTAVRIAHTPDHTVF